MQDRLLYAARALARLVLVVVAFGLAVGSIALASVRGFCPEPEGALAVALPLATIVEEPTQPLEGTDTEESGAGGTEPGAGDGAAGSTGTEAPTDGGGACPGAAQRCLPPLWSSILVLGDNACHDQAGSRLRGILVPAFVGSTVLLAGAWALRPRHADRTEPADA